MRSLIVYTRHKILSGLPMRQIGYMKILYSILGQKLEDRDYLGDIRHR
jgi:hypothetical protein